MPFLLRRTKAEVLSDLPEKIIQDRYCDLSPVQLKLYEQFSGSNAKKEISSLINVDVMPHAAEETSSSPKASAHVFQVLCFDNLNGHFINLLYLMFDVYIVMLHFTGTSILA